MMWQNLSDVSGMWIPVNAKALISEIMVLKNVQLKIQLLVAVFPIPQAATCWD